MHINNLGGPKGAATASLDRPAAPARSSFGSLVAGSTSGVPRSAAPTGTNILAKTISSQGTPGAGFGAPYTQAMTANASAGGAQAPAANLQQQSAEQKALYDIMKMSLMSFVNTSFNMNQNRPKMEFASEE
ncbi:hypothetical protein [Stigmatella aurantiaca]|uniref:Uncharacterized protein n=1 Tax=Stigmatella aurantiaca (strain DW4/3-1) TaxID=378806 RepID=Q095X4_STIAD|nr:hypothetical protein [Stigmatella aurantiaca]ADO74958.1 uncharacterized protein STAUR_7202 [Stigmatella aurantiaca DW4/3-1]EAU67565.1 conserved hypothetical protein [Stigmatella aurantiaca DW4/3-1]